MLFYADEKLLKSHPTPLIVLVFHLLLTHFCRGQSQLIGSSQPIVATLGHDIILPCHLDPAEDASGLTLEWTRADLNPRFVHVWRDGQELEGKKHPSFEGRTSLFINELKLGNISLKLSKVKAGDQGMYRCFIPSPGKQSSVQLVVGSDAVTLPVVTLAGIDKDTSGVVLQCESKGWYPEPEVVWLDGEGNLLSAGPTETVRGPDDLYTASSRVTVEKRHSNNFTCRVQQKDIHQTKETHIDVPEDFFIVPFSSAVRIGINFAVCFLCVLVLVFAVLKRRQPKIHNKMHHDNKTEDGTAEREQLVRGSTEMEDLDEEKLKKKDEEEKDLIHVISVLMEQKTELKISRDKLISQLKELKEKIWKTEKKQQNSTILHKKSNHSQKYKIEKDNMMTALQSTVDRFNKTEDVIKRITERKNEVKNQIEQIKKQLEETKRQRVDIQLQSEQIETEGDKQKS